MTTKTLRLPEDLTAAVHAVGTAEHVEESTAMRKLLRMGYELYTAEQYRAGRMTLRQAAHRLGRSMSDTLEVLRQLGVAGNVTADATLQSLRSLGKDRGRSASSVR
jgi:hypothetical protein